jgi:hypothetical protein
MPNTNVAQITEIVTMGLKKLLVQYAKAPNIQAVLTIFLTQVQNAENAWWQLYTLRSLQNAVGAQLDGIGTILGLSRGGMDDDTYRGALFIRIAELNSQGTPEELIQIFKILTGATEVIFAEIGIACFIIQGTLTLAQEEDLPFDPDQVFEAILQAKPAGVGFGLVLSADPYFGFDGDPNSLGFGDATDPTVGGNFAFALGGG